MGGYYAEPQEDATLDNQHPRRHMMFGINCFERKLVWQSREGDDDDGDFGGSITYLEPVEDYNDVVQQKRERELLAQQIVNQQFDLSSCRTIVELGASVVSLAAARIQPLHLPTSFGVVAYDFDEIRLRILQYADCYLNPLQTMQHVRPFQFKQSTHIPSLGSDAENSNDHHRSPLELPETTDLVIVTTSMMRHDFYLEENGNDHQAEHNTAERQQVKILQQLLHQATERSIPIVYTASTNPSFP
ncbi:hypothetical protein MHU86_6166 [Fragilaria crotonensis]|nr:hypothetical protein MHU86_6166 [Fragilaria crotonensis]